MTKAKWVGVCSVKAIWVVSILWGGAFAQSSGFSGLQPKIKWLYVSSGIYLDQWKNNGWEKRESFPVPPGILVGGNLGGVVAWNSQWSSSLKLPFFYNSLEEHTVTQVSGTDTTHSDEQSGIGDIELGLQYRTENGKGPVIGWNLSIPGLYTPASSNSGDGGGSDSLFARAWTGFGVVRSGLSLTVANEQNYLALYGDLVLGQFSKNGLVHQGDKLLGASWVRTLPIASTWRLKPGVDVSWSQYRWGPKSGKERTEFSIDPKVTVAYVPVWNYEISATIGATLWSKVMDASYPKENVNYGLSSRKIFIGFYFGHYR